MHFRGPSPSNQSQTSSPGHKSTFIKREKLKRKIFLLNWHLFPRRKLTIQRTTFYQQSTTTSPPKQHHETPLFPEPPLKTPANARLFHAPPTPRIFLNYPEFFEKCRIP